MTVMSQENQQRQMEDALEASEKRGTNCKSSNECRQIFRQDIEKIMQRQLDKCQQTFEKELQRQLNECQQTFEECLEKELQMQLNEYQQTFETKLQRQLDECQQTFKERSEKGLQQQFKASERAFEERLVAGANRHMYECNKKFEKMLEELSKRKAAEIFFAEKEKFAREHLARAEHVPDSDEGVEEGPTIESDVDSVNSDFQC